MKFSVLNLNWCVDSHAFDTEPLETLQATDTIISVSDQFFIHDGQPHFVVLVSHRPRPRSTKRLYPGMPPRAAAKRPTSTEPLQSLTGNERARYEAVRTFRNQRAVDLGRPPYAIMTNAQIRQIAVINAPTLTKLGTIKGIGDAKLREFGTDILAVLADMPLAEGGSDGPA